MVLKLPLNDQAALTTSPAIVAGSKVLYPKRTLTNTGVSLEAHDPNAGTIIKISSSEYSTSGTVSNAGNLFDGDTSTTVSSADGARIYWTPASNISVTKFEVYFSSSYSGYKIGVEVTGGSSQVITKSNPGNSPGWVEFTSIAGDTIGPSNQIKFRSYRSNDTDPGILGINAVRVNDKIVTTTGGAPKKHYDNHADFGTTSEDKYLTVPASTNFSFGNDPWCIECWANIRSVGSDGTAIFDFNAGAGYTSEEWICGYCLGSDVWFYWGNGSYLGISATLTTNQWQHWAWTWDGTTARLFRDGTLAASTTTTNKSAGWGSFTREITIGKQNLLSRFGDQLIQDFRIYKGVAKYTANFTPPGAILV